jgi:CRISPR-associated endonuclease/helicase Cas3
LLDLFDTTPDLSGNELDVSRFIRSTDGKDVYLAWRSWQGDVPPEDLPELEDEELCPVPIGDVRAFAKKHAVFTLNFATEDWIQIADETPIYPGMRAVTRAAEGGYTPLEGWSPESKGPVSIDQFTSNREAETDTSNRLSFGKYRQTLRAHTDRVVEKMDATLARRDLDASWATALRAAALKHDWGKAHEAFQETLHWQPGTPLLAKQCGRGKHRIRHFRHELASALAMLQTGDSDLAAYLAAAHHGRIRMGIRSMPGEREEGGAAIARGIRDGDRLPECELASGAHVPQVTLSLAVMEFGAEIGSWTDRMLRVRDGLGPFRLAYFEMLLRAADWGASEEPGPEIEECPSSN